MRAESAERYRVTSAHVCHLLEALGFCSSLALKCPGTRHGPKGSFSAETEVTVACQLLRYLSKDISDSQKAKHRTWCREI